MGDLPALRYAENMATYTGKSPGWTISVKKRFQKYLSSLELCASSSSINVGYMTSNWLRGTVRHFCRKIWLCSASIRSGQDPREIILQFGFSMLSLLCNRFSRIDLPLAGVPLTYTIWYSIKRAIKFVVTSALFDQTSGAGII
jgi:hypothetical protein